MTSLDVIVKQMILSAFRSANMTSASPGHINHFIGIESQGGMDIIGSDEEMRAAVLEAVSEFMQNPESAETLSQDLLDAEVKTGKIKGRKEAQLAQTVSRVAGAGQNPASVVAMGIQFLPHAVLVTLALSLVPLIFEQMTKPGGPLDLRFKRIIDDEINAFLSRQTQKDTEMGVRQVIVQSKKGFTAGNGVNNYNTVREIREGGFDKNRLDRIGKVDHSKGVFDFG